MIVLQILILGILLLAAPVGVGYLVADVDKNLKKLPMLWISGQMILWAIFQMVCVPMVLKEMKTYHVFSIYILVAVVLLFLAAALALRRRKQSRLHVISDRPRSTCSKVAWGAFWLLLLFQLIQAVVMAYADGDDAFYIAEATQAVDAETMYHKIPYTGKMTELDMRHGMAPFPIWIAFLSKMSGIRTVSVAQVLLPMALISMTYGIYYLLGSKLFAKKQEMIPLFLVFTEVLVLFGDYSFYTVENFMLARSRQGKAALGSIIIPMLILLLLLLLEKLQESQRITMGYWILLAATLTAACLCSTLGALLVCMMVGITGVCAAVCYRKWRVLVPMALCCSPCVIYAVLYLVLG